MFSKMNNIRNVLEDNRFWYSIAGLLGLLVCLVYYNGFKIGFFYDDYVFFRHYSNKELVFSLSGDWNFGQRIENSGFRPLANILFYTIWDSFKTDLLYYRLLSSILIITQLGLAISLLKKFVSDKSLILFGALLFLVFSDQYNYRIWLTELVSMFSNVLALFGIYFITKGKKNFNLALSYLFIIFASIIKETNLPFLIMPIISQLVFKEKYKNVFILFQFFSVSAFVVGYLVIRQQALLKVTSEAIPVRGIGLHSIKLLIDFVTDFSFSFGITPYAACIWVLICFPIGCIYLIVYLRSHGLKNISSEN